MKSIEKGINLSRQVSSSSSSVCFCFSKQTNKYTLRCVVGFAYLRVAPRLVAPLECTSPPWYRKGNCLAGWPCTPCALCLELGCMASLHHSEFVSTLGSQLSGCQSHPASKSLHLPSLSLLLLFSSRSLARVAEARALPLTTVAVLSHKAFSSLLFSRASERYSKQKIETAESLLQILKPGNHTSSNLNNVELK